MKIIMIGNSATRMHHDHIRMWSNYIPSGSFFYRYHSLFWSFSIKQLANTPSTIIENIPRSKQANATYTINGGVKSATFRVGIFVGIVTIRFNLTPYHHIHIARVALILFAIGTVCTHVQLLFAAIACNVVSVAGDAYAFKYAIEFWLSFSWFFRLSSQLNLVFLIDVCCVYGCHRTCKYTHDSHLRMCCLFSCIKIFNTDDIMHCNFALFCKLWSIKHIWWSAFYYDDAEWLIKMVLQLKKVTMNFCNGDFNGKRCILG